MTFKPPAHLALSAVSALLVGAALVFAAPRTGGAQAAALDTAAIDRAIGKAGQSSGEVYKVTFPRSDLHVTVQGLSIKPGLALTGWAAFKAVDSEAVTHGDLALTEAEVNPVVGKLRAGQIEVTACAWAVVPGRGGRGGSSERQPRRPITPYVNRRSGDPVYASYRQ
jgi:Domain of Unknown Function (DUF1259)